MALNTRIAATDRTEAASALQRNELVWYGWFALLMLLTAALGLWLTRAGRAGPEPIVFAWFGYAIGALLIIYRPRYGLYLILFFTLIADSRLMPAYPFTKNFSSRESLFYIADTVIISPLEVYLLITFCAWLFKRQMKRRLEFFTGELLWPALAFTLFVVIGLVYGLGVRGGDVRIGLWEARPILYLPLLLILTGNLLRKPGHVNAAMWTIMLALLVKGIAGNVYFFGELGTDISGVDRITEHATAIHFNTVFVFAIGAWLYNASPTKRALLPLFALVVLVPYLATQRRAAFITLGIAFVLTGVVLYRANRRAFWLLVPPAAAAGVIYLIVFWNSSSTIGLPARAVQSVVSRRVTDPSDWSSNFYRILENLNIAFTIHQSPLTGVGFGNQFYFRVVLPDISFFEWWQYITHNSILWIWMKTGLGGFLSMLTLLAMAIMTGVRSLWRMPGGDLSAIAMVAVFYIFMHFAYAYVDMSWDTQSMVYVGTMMGLAHSLEAIVEPASPTRWPWRSARRLVAKGGSLEWVN